MSEDDAQLLPVPPRKTYASADLLDPVKRAALDAADEEPTDPALEAAFTKGAGANASLIGGGPVAPTPAQRQATNDLAAGAKLLHIARNFIREHEIGCAEDTVEDRVYENAPGLVEKLGEVVGFYRHSNEEES